MMRAPWAVLALLLAGWSPAHAAMRSWQVTDFTRLRVEGPYTVRVRSGGPAAVRATGPQAAIDTLDIEQRGDTLFVHQIRTAGGANWSSGRADPLVVEVSTRALAAAALSGSGTVTIDRMRGDLADMSLGGAGDLSVADVDVATAKLAMNGTGNLGIAGRARHADALLVGAGDIHADGLTAETATVKLVGTGNAKLAATRTVAVELQGAGDVAITGPAACTVHRTGSGDVHCAREKQAADGG